MIMEFVLEPQFIYTLFGLFVVITLNTLWAIGHALVVGEFDSTRLPEFLVDDIFKLAMLGLVGLSAMVRIEGADATVAVIFESLRYAFLAFSAIFAASLVADLLAKFRGKFGDEDIM